MKSAPGSRNLQDAEKELLLNSVKVPYIEGKHEKPKPPIDKTKKQLISMVKFHWEEMDLLIIIMTHPGITIRGASKIHPAINSGRMTRASKRLELSGLIVRIKGEYQALNLYTIGQAKLLELDTSLKIRRYAIKPERVEKAKNDGGKGWEDKSTAPAHVARTHARVRAESDIKATKPQPKSRWEWLRRGKP